MYKNIQKLWGFIGKKRQIQFKILIFLMILSSFAEILSIGAVFPFFKALMRPDLIYKNVIVGPLLKVFNASNSDDIILLVTILFILAIISASAIRVIFTWISVRLSFAMGRDLSNDIYKKTLHQPYEVHISRNSSDVINGIWIKVSEVIFYILMPLLTLISSTILVLTIVVTLMFVTPGIALISMICLGFIYGIIIKFTKNKLKEGSNTISQESNNIVKNLQEGLNGIKDVIIDGSQETFCSTYYKTSTILRKAQGNTLIISQIPSFVLTALGMILIIFLSYNLTIKGGFVSALPILAALTLGLQRLLPNAQQLYSSWTTMNGSQASLSDVISLLEQPYPIHFNEQIDLLSFSNQIVLKDVSFRYNNEKSYVLSNFNLVIKKGSRIGFIGTTGCGKSTLLDIVMGLLKTTKGYLIVDGQVITEKNCRAWQTHISHVPQNVFLADSSIESNIAFGVPNHLINKDKVRIAAQKAQLADIVETWPDKYETRVGERGVQLSGGQCQRIGIARALYKEADVIVLDEATSALDGETENAVIESIKELSKDITILVIAHRLNTLDFCTEIIELEQGGIIKSIKSR